MVAETQYGQRLLDRVAAQAERNKQLTGRHSEVGSDEFWQTMQTPAPEHLHEHTEEHPGMVRLAPLTQRDLQLANPFVIEKGQLRGAAAPAQFTQPHARR